MRYLKKYEKVEDVYQQVPHIIGPTFHKETDIKIRQMYPDTWKELQLYRPADVDKLFKIYSFERHFDEALEKCLKDVFGQNCLSSGEVVITESKKKELALLIVNGLNWYSFLKKMYDKQIIFPRLRVTDTNSIDSICWGKDFQSAIDRFFEYIWGFRSAIFCKNDIKHRDVIYIQKNIYTKIYNDELIKRKGILKIEKEPPLGGL